MELLVLLKLKWDPYAPTAKDFVATLLQSLVDSGVVESDHLVMVKRHAHTYVDLIAIGKSISNLKNKNFGFLRKFENFCE